MVASLGLSKDQIKSIAMLPLSSNLGSDQIASSQGIPVSRGASLRSAKVKSCCGIQGESLLP